MKNTGFILSAISVLAVAFLLRSIALTSIPYGLSWDEAAYAANAHSLLMSGADEWGVSFPVFLKSFGEYKPAGLSYLIASFLLIFRNPELATRLSAVFLGIVSIVGSMIITRVVSRSSVLAIIVGALLATSPWHIHYSKTATDPIVGLALLCLGLSAWLKPNKWLQIGGAILLALSMYAYNAERVFVPIFLLLWGIYEVSHSKKLTGSKIASYAVVYTASMGLILATILTPIGTRAKETSLWHSSIIKQPLADRTAVSAKSNMQLYWIINNKFVEFSRAAGERYVAQLRPDFLFFSQQGFFADLGFSRHGNMLFVTLPFFAIGLFFSIRAMHKSGVFFLLWLLVSPLPAALTIDGPHTGRSLALVVPLCYFSAYGITVCVQALQAAATAQRIAMVGIATALVFSAGLWFQDYLLFGPKELNREYQGYSPELSRTLSDARSTYKQVFVSGSERGRHQLLYMLLYEKLDPKPLQSEINHESIHTVYENISLTQSHSDLACALLQPNSLVIMLPNEYAELGISVPQATVLVSPENNLPQYVKMESSQVTTVSQQILKKTCQSVSTYN